MKYRKKPVVIDAIKLGIDNVDVVCEFCPPGRTEPNSLGVLIKTLEGEMQASWGDFVIRGIKGEVYPCKPDIFNASYITVEEE